MPATSLTLKLETQGEEDSGGESPKILVKSKLNNNTTTMMEEGKENDDRESVLSREIIELQHQLDRAHEDLQYSQSELSLLDEEKSNRIECLEERLHNMEENEVKLSETVSELEEIEKKLREKIKSYENAATAGSSDNVGVSSVKSSSTDKINELSDENQSLKSHVQQLLQRETKLQEKVADLEENLNQEQTQEQLESEELKETIRGLREKNERLVEELYKTKLENNELQEHVDQLIEDNKGDSSYEQTPFNQSRDSVNEQMTEKVKELESEIERLKDELLKAKLDAMKTLKESGDFPEGYDSLQDLQNRLKDLESKETELNNKLLHFESDNKELLQENSNLKQNLQVKQSVVSETESKLKEKIEVLQDAEEKLMEQNDVLGEANEQLKEQVARLSEKVADSQGSSEELQVKLGHMRKREQGLLQVIETIKQKHELSAKQDESEKEDTNKQQQHELNSLKEKVSILVDSESKLMDQLEEREERISTLETQIEQYKESATHYELEKVEVAEKLKRLQILEEMHEGNVKLQQIAEERIAKLEESEQVLKEKLVCMESQEKLGDNDDDGVSVENTYLQKQVLELEGVVEDYETVLQQNKTEHQQLTSKLSELEDNEKILKNKINELQVKNNELQKTVQNLQEHQQRQENGVSLLNGHCRNNNNDSELEDSPLTLSDIKSVVIPKTVDTLQSSSRRENLRSLLNDYNNSSPESSSQSLTNPVEDSQDLTYSPVDDSTIQVMSEEEVVAKLYEIQRVESVQRAKIKEMKEHLDYFRRAMEVVAAALEADAELPVLKMRPKSMDSDFETRVNELVKSEVVLKLKVLEMEKKYTILR